VGVGFPQVMWSTVAVPVPSCQVKGMTWPMLAGTACVVSMLPHPQAVVTGALPVLVLVALTLVLSLLLASLPVTVVLLPQAAKITTSSADASHRLIV
jgi:hypothetical protein